MKKRKARVLIDAFHLYNALTGIRTYSVVLFEALEQKDDHYCEYLIYPNWKRAVASPFLKGKLGLIKKLINHGSFLLHKQLVLPLYARFMSVDAIVSLDFVLPKFKPGKRSFVVIHDVFFWELEENYPDMWRSYFTSMISQGINDNTVLISTSAYTSSKIREFVNQKNPIEVVYQSPKLLEQNDAADDAKLLDELGLESGQYIFHVGLLDKRKNLLTLIKAFAIYLKHRPESPMQLVLAGERGIGKAQDIYQDILQLINTNGLEGRVILPGFVSNKVLGALYRNTFLYVFPSFDEGFGIPVLEAFNAGVPVVVSDRGALQEVAGDAALSFSAESAEELCDRIIDHEGETTRNMQIELGKQRIRKFTQDRFMKSFDQAIAKYLA